MPGLTGIFFKIMDDFMMSVTSEQPWTGCETEAEEVPRHLPMA